MRYLLILISMTSIASAQSFVVSGGNRSFVISASVATPATVKPIVIEKPDPPPVFVEVQRPEKILIRRPDPPRVVNTPWGVIDLATYNRPGCNCPMCQGIRSMQYQYQSALANPQYTEQVTVASQAPTPDAVIEQTSRLLALTRNDVLADLGCGDGRILIAAVKRYGCKAIGIEIDPEIAESARRRVKEAGLPIEIITGDAITFKPTDHGVTAITAYLYPELLSKLVPVFKSPGVRVVASPYHSVSGLPMKQCGEVWVYFAQKAVVRTNKRYLAMFTASYCGPCQTWKATQKKTIEDRGFVVREYEMTNQANSAKYGARIQSLPTFVVCDYDTGEWLTDPMVGSRSAGDILPLLK